MKREPAAGAPWIAELAARLASPRPARLPASESRHASILVPLFVDSGELWTVLTQRSEQLTHHRGQVAFPGGVAEVGENAWDAALRESEEEVGLDPRLVLRLGQLDEQTSPAGFRIVPCVAAIPYPLRLAPNESEIAEIFAAPLAALADPSRVEEREVTLNGTVRSLRVYRFGRWQIWGLTARILENLLTRLGLATP